VADVVERHGEEQFPDIPYAGRRERPQLLVVSIRAVMAWAKIVGFEVAPVTE
jgi:hypothetical protein